MRVRATVSTNNLCFTLDLSLSGFEFKFKISRNVSRLSHKNNSTAIDVFKMAMTRVEMRERLGALRCGLRAIKNVHKSWPRLRGAAAKYSSDAKSSIRIATPLFFLSTSRM